MSTYAPYTYTNAEGGTEFTIPFDYIDDSHLSVYVNDALKTLKKDYWIDRNNNKIVFRSATTAGHPVRIERSTPSTIKFKDGSPLTQRQFNNLVEEQLLFFQEQQFLKTDGNLLCRNNLSDVASAATSRTNLGVYSTSETAGLADLYLENANNLSDLHDVPTARTNLDVYSKGETSDRIDAHVPTWTSGATIPQLTGVDQRFKMMQCKLVSTHYSYLQLEPYLGDYVYVGGTVRQLVTVYCDLTGLAEGTVYYVYLNYSSGFSLSCSTTAPNTTYYGIQGIGTGASFTPVVGILLGGINGYRSNWVFSWYNPEAVTGAKGVSIDLLLDEGSVKQGATIENILVPAGYNYYVALHQWMFIGGFQSNDCIGGWIQVTGDITQSKHYGKWTNYPEYNGWTDCIELRGSVTSNKIITVTDWVDDLDFHDPVPTEIGLAVYYPTLYSHSLLTVIVSP
jgi:hypothetical protein